MTKNHLNQLEDICYVQSQGLEYSTVCLVLAPKVLLSAGTADLTVKSGCLIGFMFCIIVTLSGGGYFRIVPNCVIQIESSLVIGKESVLF